MTTKNEKMTYVKALTMAIEQGNLPTEVVEKLTALKEQQEKRNTGDKKPTKLQQENEGIKTHILELLEGHAPVTISELLTLDEAFEGMSNQKMASLVRLLVNENKLKRTEEKRKAYFSLAD